MRRRATTPNIDESNYAFDEYKVIMEELKREHPDLTPNVLKQMAVERFSSVKEKRCSHSQNNLMNEMFAGMFNFRFGLGKKLAAPTAPPTSNDSDAANDPKDHRRRLNPRASVSNIDAKALMSQSFVSGISSDGEDSLENSLQNIEASIAPPRRQSIRRGRMNSLKRASLRASLTRSSTELVDVQEDEELYASIPDTLVAQGHQDFNSTKNGPGSHNETTTDRKGSVSDELPDEIKAAFGVYDDDDGQRSLGCEGSRRRRNNKSTTSSIASSFGSIDSANFKGDFSAWEYKNNIEGDFSAWGY